MAGLALGIFALWYMPRIKRGRARAAAGRSGKDGDGDDSEAAPPQSTPRDSDSNTVSSTETPGRSTRS